MRSTYERLAEMLKEVFPFTIGPSRLILLVSNPILSVPWYFCISPSLVRTSITEESRPPKRAGKELLNQSDLFAPLRGIKTEKKAEQMVYIIYRCSVQQDKVLVGTSSAYIQSGGTVHSGLYSGHKLNGFPSRLPLPICLGMFFNFVPLESLRHPFAWLLLRLQLLSEIMITSSSCVFPCIRIFSRVSLERVNLRVSVA